MDSNDNSSDANDSSGNEASSSAAVGSCSVSSSDMNAYYRKQPSYAAAEESSDPESEENLPDVPSDPASEENLPDVPSDPASDENLPDVPSDPATEENIPNDQKVESPRGSSEEDRSTSDILIFKALEKACDEGNDSGLDLDEIFNFVEERYVVVEDCREQLEEMLGDLVLDGQLEKVGNLYKIAPGKFDNPRYPARLLGSADSTSMRPKDTPSTSSSSFVRRAPPEENPQINAAVKEVAEAEQLVLQAKEAQELADKHAQLLKFENHIMLQFAVEILNRCANGQKIFLR